MRTYDEVFNEETTQDKIFEETRRLIRHAFKGYNVWIFAYGATGSGKTYTIQGTPENPGLWPRSIKEIFEIREEMINEGVNVTLECQILELYCEQLTDLIYITREISEGKKIQNIKKKKIEVMFGKIDDPVKIKNAESFQVDSEEIANELYKQCIENRKTASTNFNEHSSRSHLIFTISLKMYNTSTNKQAESKISIIDLAGSENLKNEENKLRQDEGISVNKSLSALKNVIKLLAENESRQGIPYRDSIITKIMKDSLGGNSKTLVFINLSPTQSWINQTNQSFLL